jgi:hypothetical protein
MTVAADAGETTRVAFLISIDRVVASYPSCRRARPASSDPTKTVLPGSSPVQAPVDRGGPVSIVNKVRLAVLWVGLLAVGLFSAGVGAAVLVWGVEATPGWLRALAMGLGVGLTIAVVRGTAEWAMSRRSVSSRWAAARPPRQDQ